MCGYVHNVRMVRPELPDKWRRVKAIIQEKENASSNYEVVDELYKIVTTYYGETLSKQR